MTENRVLVLYVPTKRRDEFVDVLMGCEALSGFSLLPALGYSREHSHFNTREQVVGYRRFDRFEIFLAEADLSVLLEKLGHASGRERLRYWIHDCSEDGHLPS